jgi:hypothetical protein
MGQDPRVRAAFELALDRQVINQVVYEGMYTPTAQPVPPTNPLHVPGFQPEPRNLDRARALLREVGVRTPLAVEMTVPNSPDLRQAAEVMQAMLREAGFELRINTMEFASSLQAATRGEFETYLLGWSGRVDPDGNTWTFMHSRGPSNDGRYANPEVDRLLDTARLEQDPARRRELQHALQAIHPAPLEVAADGEVDAFAQDQHLAVLPQRVRNAGKEPQGRGSHGWVCIGVCGRGGEGGEGRGNTGHHPCTLGRAPATRGVACPCAQGVRELETACKPQPNRGGGGQPPALRSS